MIDIQLNGQKTSLSAPLTVWELLEEMDLPRQAIAVAINFEVIPRSSFEKVRVRDKDRVEIIRPAGGG